MENHLEIQDVKPIIILPTTTTPPPNAGSESPVVSDSQSQPKSPVTLRIRTPSPPVPVVTPLPTSAPMPALVPSTQTHTKPKFPALLGPTVKPPKPPKSTRPTAQGGFLKTKTPKQSKASNASSGSGPPPLVPRTKCPSSKSQPPKSIPNPVNRDQLTPLKIVLLDHNYSLPAPLYTSKDFHSKFSLTSRDYRPSRFKPIKFLFKIPDEINSPLAPPYKPPPSRLENLLKRSTALPVFSSISTGPGKVKPYYYGSSLYRDEEQDVEVDIEALDPEPPISYDKDKAYNLMNECEKYVNFARTTDVPENWEEQIVKTGWTKTQRSLFDSVMKAFHSEHFARLSYKDNSSEPVLRRASLDLTAQRVRQALVNVMWNTKLTQWLHGVLIDNLSLGYLGIYLDVLQTLRPKCPALVDKMVLLSTAAASSLSDPEALRASLMKQKEESGENAPESEELKKILNAEALNLLLKRQWDPFASVLHEQTKLACNPVFLIVPNGPSWCHPTNARRYKQFLNMLAGVGKVISVTMNHDISICSVMTVHEFAEKMIHFSKLKLAEIKSLFPDRPIFLMGWGSGAIVAATVSLTEKVSGVLCLGFPLLGLSGRRGENSDPLLQMKHPVLFVIGDRAANNTVALMDKFRQDLPVQTKANLLVVRGADGGLKVSRQFRKRLLLTQGYVDKLIVDEITQFVKDVIETKPPTIPSHLTGNLELKKQKGRKRMMPDPLFGETGITFNGREYKFSDESKAIPSNYSCNKRKNYQRTRSVNSESGEELFSKTITASQLVQSASTVPKKRKSKSPPLTNDNVSVQEAVSNIIDLTPTTSTTPVEHAASYMLNPDVSVVPTSVPLNRSAALEQTSLPNSVLGTQLALAKPSLLTRNRKSVDKPLPPKMPRLEEDAERIEFKPHLYSGSPDTKPSVVPASQIILQSSTPTSQLSIDSTSMSNTIVIRTPTPLSSPSLVPANPLTARPHLHPQMPSLILKNRISGEPIQFVTPQPGPGQIIALRPSLSHIKPGVEVASGIIRIPVQSYRPFYTYSQQSPSGEPRKILKVVRTSDLKEYMSQGGDLSKVLAPPTPTGEINLPGNGSSTSPEATIFNTIPGMVGPRFGARSSVVIVRSKPPSSTPMIFTSSAPLFIQSAAPKPAISVLTPETPVVTSTDKEEVKCLPIIQDMNGSQPDACTLIVTPLSTGDTVDTATEEKKIEDESDETEAQGEQILPEKSILKEEVEELVEKTALEPTPELASVVAEEPASKLTGLTLVSATSISEQQGGTDSELKPSFDQPEGKDNTYTEEEITSTSRASEPSEEPTPPLPKPIKANRNSGHSPSKISNQKRPKPQEKESPEFTRRETRRSSKSESSETPHKDSTINSSITCETKDATEVEPAHEKIENVRTVKAFEKKSRDKSMDKKDLQNKEKNVDKMDREMKEESAKKSEEKTRVTRASLRKNSLSGNTKQ